MKDITVSLRPPEADSLVGNTSFIRQYKTIHDKTGVEQINAARFQKKIALNLKRIKYL